MKKKYFILFIILAVGVFIIFLYFNYNSNINKEMIYHLENLDKETDITYTRSSLFDSHCTNEHQDYILNNMKNSVPFLKQYMESEQSVSWKVQAFTLLVVSPDESFVPLIKKEITTLGRNSYLRYICILALGACSSSPDDIEYILNLDCDKITKIMALWHSSLPESFIALVDFVDEKDPVRGFIAFEMIMFRAFGVKVDAKFTFLLYRFEDGEQDIQKALANYKAVLSKWINEPPTELHYSKDGRIYKSDESAVPFPAFLDKNRLYDDLKNN